MRPAARLFSAVVWSASLSFSQGITSQVRYVLKTGLTEFHTLNSCSPISECNTSLNIISHD